MNVKLKGIVVLETDFSETDKYIDILTYSHGKVSVLCKGVRKKNSKLQNRTRLFSFCDFELYQKNDRFLLNDAIIIESFFGITEDLSKFALSSYFLQVCSKLAVEPDEKVARTLIYTLYALTKQNRDLKFVKSVFELRIMADSGFMPVLDRCYMCQKIEDIKEPVFDLINGGICCKLCINSLENTVLISQSVLKSMHHIIYSDVKKLYSFNLLEKSLDILSNLTENYLKIQTDYNFKTLEFYKMIGE